MYPTQFYPSQVYPSQIYPSQIYPSQIYPSQIYPSQVYPFRLGAKPLPLALPTGACLSRFRSAIETATRMQ